MQISKPLRILIGIGTLWFAFYPLLFLAVWVMMLFGILLTAASDQPPTPFTIIPFFAIFPLHCLTFLLTFALMAFYIVHLVKNKVGSETVRVLLGLGLFFLPMIAMPVYYFTYVWPETPPAWALETRGTGRKEEGNGV